LASCTPRSSLKEGDLVEVDGRLQTRKWTDKEGKDHWTTEVVALRLIVPGKEAVTKSTTRTEASDAPDLPF
jgi:single-stranded DNA-binding protein